MIVLSAGTRGESSNNPQKHLGLIVCPMSRDTVNIDQGSIRRISSPPVAVPFLLNFVSENPKRCIFFSLEVWVTV